MKIIRSFTFIIAGIFSATLAKAQQPATAKPIETPKANVELKNIPREMPVDAKQAAPSPGKRDADNKKPVEETKVVALDKNSAVAAIPGDTEQAKILAGKTEKPKESVFSPSTIDPALKPAPPAKPPVQKQQTNQ